LPEPITAAAILATIGELAKSTTGLVASSQPVKDWYQGVQARLAGKLSDPKNHDLVRGIRTAHLCALERVLRQYRKVIEDGGPFDTSDTDKSFYESAQGFVSDRLNTLRAGTIDIGSVTAGQIRNVLSTVVDPAAAEAYSYEACFQDCRAAAEAAALAELEKDAGRPCPTIFRNLFEGRLGRRGSSWYEQFALFICEQLKTNQRFQTAVVSGQAASLLRSSEGLEQRLAALVQGGTEDITRQVTEIAGDISGLAEDVRQVAQQIGFLADRQQQLRPRVGTRLEYADPGISTPAQRISAVGDLITWDRMLQGLYMPRPRAMDRLLGRFIDWFGTIDRTISAGRLPVFWIDGRSGDGKSVLLMQLAHRLLADQPNSVMFKPVTAARTPLLVEHAITVLEEGTTAVVVVDDMHRVADLEDWEAEMAALIAGGSQRIVALACGPTPERQVFERSVRSVAVHPVTCPRLRNEDVQQIAKWFDRPIPDDTSAEDDILVEVLFEMKVGEPIPAFARSFKYRLQQRGLFEVVSRALAVNIFGALAPLSLLTNARQLAALQEMAREDQLHFAEDEDLGVPGFRLVHSRIAWRLFREWALGDFSQADVGAILAEELSAVLRSVPSDKYQYNIAVLKGVRDQIEDLSGGEEDGEPIGRFDLLEMLIAALEGAPVVQAYAARAALLAGIVGAVAGDSYPRALQVATSACDIDSLPGAVRIRIAIDLCRTPGVSPEVLEVHRRKLDQMLSDPELGGEIGSYAHVLLQDSAFGGEANRWIDKLLGLIDKVGTRPGSQNFLESLIAWMQGRDHFNDVVARALAWLDEVGTHPGSQNVLRTLIATTQGREDVVARALIWLDEAGTRAGSQTVLESLIAATQGRDDFEEVVALALAWLDQVGTGAGSQDVLKTLIAATQGRDNFEEVRALALTWLDDTSNHSGSQDVLKTLIAATQDRDDFEEVVALALAWLDEAGTRAGSQDVVKTLIAATQGRDDVAERALTWLDDAGTRAGSQEVLGPLIAATQGRDDFAEVLERALTWLEDTGTHPGSPTVFGPLIAATRGRDDFEKVKARALIWLDDAGTRAGSQKVLGPLIAATQGLDDFEEVVARALAWLDDAGTHVGTQEVLYPLIAATQGRDDVVARSLAWLGDNGQSAGIVLNGKSLNVFGYLANHASEHPRVAELVQSALNSSAKLGQRAQVLRWWINGGGPSGSGVRFLLTAKHQIDRSERDKRDFAMLTIATSYAALTVLNAAIAQPENASDLCYLLSRVPLNDRDYSIGQTVLEERENWPPGCEGYLWRAVIQDQLVDPDAYRDNLVQWLGDGHRRGFTEVARALANRSDIDGELLVYLPAKMRSEVARLRNMRG